MYGEGLQDSDDKIIINLNSTLDILGSLPLLKVYFCCYYILFEYLIRQ